MGAGFPEAAAQITLCTQPLWDVGSVPMSTFQMESQRSSGDIVQGPNLAVSRAEIQTQIYPAGLILCQKKNGGDHFSSHGTLEFATEAQRRLGTCSRSHSKSVVGSPAGATD